MKSFDYLKRAVVLLVVSFAAKLIGADLIAWPCLLGATILVLFALGTDI